MTLRVLFYMLVAACVTSVQTTSAQSKPSGAVTSSGPTQETIDRLLKYETAALDHFQQVLAPTLRCYRADKESRQLCDGMITTLKDEAQQAAQNIARYLTSRTPGDLFDTYVHLQFLLKEIEIFSIEDEYNGDHNHKALAEGYNSFVKLTEGAFTGEMKQIIGSCAR